MKIQRDENGARCVRKNGMIASAIPGGWWHITYRGDLLEAWIPKEYARKVLCESDAAREHKTFELYVTVEISVPMVVNAEYHDDAREMAECYVHGIVEEMSFPGLKYDSIDIEASHEVNEVIR